MSTCDFATDSTRITTRPAIVMRAVNAVANLYRVWKNRRSFNRLNEMTDSELADIGLTRADLKFATATPLGSDPTLQLRRIAYGRTAPVGDRPIV